MSRHTENSLRFDGFFEKIADVDTSPPCRKRDSDCIYIVQYADRVKIGMTCNPGQRLNRIRLMIGLEPDRMWLISPVKNAGRVEAVAHLILKEKRGIGEWFWVSMDEAIAAVRHANGEVGYWPKRVAA